MVVFLSRCSQMTPKLKKSANHQVPAWLFKKNLVGWHSPRRQGGHLPNLLAGMTSQENGLPSFTRQIDRLFHYDIITLLHYYINMTDCLLPSFFSPSPGSCSAPFLLAHLAVPKCRVQIPDLNSHTPLHRAFHFVQSRIFPRTTVPDPLPQLVLFEVHYPNIQLSTPHFLRFQTANNVVF